MRGDSVDRSPSWPRLIGRARGSHRGPHARLGVPCMIFVSCRWRGVTFQTANRRSGMAARYVVIVLAVGCSIGCANAPSAIFGGVADSAYVGFAIPIADTGNGSAIAPYANGARLGLDQLNATRPRGARPLALRLPRRGLSDLPLAVAFRDDPTVVGVIGHLGSGPTMAAAPVYADLEHDGRHALVAVAPTSTNPRVTQTTHWVFRVCPTDDDGARAVARYVAVSLHLTRVAILYQDNLFGRGYWTSVTRELVAHGVTVLEHDPYVSNISGYDAYATRLTRRGAEAIIMAGEYTDVLPIIREARRQGSRAALIGGDAFSGMRSVPALAKEFAGLRYTTFYDSTDVSSATRAFAEAYRRRFGVPAEPGAALAYDAATVIGRAELAVGPNRARIRDWIAHAPPLAGATGTIRFAPNSGDPIDKQVEMAELHP